MDCFTSFAMIKNNCHYIVVATSNNIVYSRIVIVRIHRTRGNLVILGSSLREPKVRGNLGMEHYDSQTKFCGNP